MTPPKARAADKGSVLIKRNVEVKVPQTPNYISRDGDYRSVSDFSDDELREIGLAWIEALIAKADRLRKLKEEPR